MGRFNVACILRANTYNATAASCIKITKKMLDSKLVVRSIESHGMRALARQVTRQRGPYKIERPENEQDRKYTKAEVLDWSKAESTIYGGGQVQFTEGTFIVWDVDMPENKAIIIKDYLDEHEDVIRVKFISEAHANPPQKCDGMQEVDYERIIGEMNAKRPQLYPHRATVPNRMPGGGGLFATNKQHGESKLRPNAKKLSDKSLFGQADLPGQRDNLNIKEFF